MGSRTHTSELKNQDHWIPGSRVRVLRSLEHHIVRQFSGDFCASSAKGEKQYVHQISGEFWEFDEMGAVKVDPTYSINLMMFKGIWVLEANYF